MKSHRGRSPTVRKAQRPSSPQYSSRVRPNVSNVVPSGTVASRVSFLENHPSPAYSPLRRPTPNRIRGQSRTGFGRRMTNRFGKPASRNEHPYEEPQVEIEHSFLGLNSTRSKHLHKHGFTDGIADRRDTYSRANGIHGQMHHQRLMERGQYDAASPWSVTPEKHNSTCWKRNEMDVFKEGDGSGIKCHFPGRISIFPTLKSGIGHADMYSRGTKSRQGSTMKSDISAVTTSTVRRQSVRDLFDHHGIERPHGLVSDEALSREETPQQVKSKIRCHNCAWYNSETSDWCGKCKMVLRAISHMESQSLISPMGQPSCTRNGTVEDPSSPDSSAKENQPSKQPKKQMANPRPGPWQLQNPKDALWKFGKLSTLPTKFPSLNMAHSPPRSRMASRQVTIPEPPLMPRLLKGSRTTTIVKESPFIVADRLLSAKSSQYITITPQGDMHCPTILSNCDQYQKGDAVSNDSDCESPGCRATHENHQPYRHSIVCSRLKKHVPEETDNGYVADTSFAEDSGEPKSLLPYMLKSHISRQRSNRSLKSKRQEISHQSLGSDYVECRGYPRTGHARHGSATSGTLGQCQHCIDDCQCSACQNTHHSVRCCLNENHQGMVHHHHSSRAVSNIVNPLGCPTLSCYYAESSEVLPLASPARKASRVVPPAIPRMKTPQSSSVTSRMDASIQPLSKQSTIEKARSLPRSKQGTSLRGVFKQPTPPPWVSDSTSKTQSSTQVSKLQVSGTTADTIFDVEGIPDPPPPFKERPTLPPPPPCDISSPEQGGNSLVRTWVNMLSNHEHKDNSPGSVILSCDESGWENEPGSTSARSVARAIKTSTPDSKKASRKFSEFFRFGQRNNVPLLNQKLLEHQEELRKIEKQCDHRIEILTRESETYGHSLQPPVAAREDKGKGVERETSYTSSKASGATKKRRFLGFSLEDKKPTTPCHNDGPVQEHMLSEDATADEKGILNVPGTLMDFETKIDEHECVWRTRFVASQNEIRSQRRADQECGDQALKGITFVVHIEGKDDMVIEADLRGKK